VKKLVKAIVRSFGHEDGEIAPVPSEVHASFLSPAEAELDFDVADDTVQAIGHRVAEVAPQATAGQAAKTLIVEGWRFLAHSYAMVNQWQLLALSRRSDVAVRVSDAPLYGRRWQTQDGLFEPPAEQILNSLPIATADEAGDVRLRISFPFDFLPSRSRLTAVFATSENQTMRREQFGDPQAFEKFRRTPPPAEVKVVTPSRWSAEGFYKCGLAPEQVLIVPHGVDIDTFHPMPALRNPVRRKLALFDDAFVFLSIGAMTGNKGRDLLLQAFATV